MTDLRTREVLKDHAKSIKSLQAYMAKLEKKVADLQLETKWLTLKVNEPANWDYW